MSHIGSNRMGILSTSVASPPLPYCLDDLANEDMCCRDPVDIYKRSSGGVVLYDGIARVWEVNGAYFKRSC